MSVCARVLETTQGKHHAPWEHGTRAEINLGHSPTRDLDVSI